jgi:hypothetical protein
VKIIKQCAFSLAQKTDTSQNSTEHVKLRFRWVQLKTVLTILLVSKSLVCFSLLKAMVGILQVNGFGEESTLMQDLKPFRILISLLDKPELGNIWCCSGT